MIPAANRAGGVDFGGDAVGVFLEVGVEPAGELGGGGVADGVWVVVVDGAKAMGGTDAAALYSAHPPARDALCL